MQFFHSLTDLPGRRGRVLRRMLGPHAERRARLTPLVPYLSMMRAAGDEPEPPLPAGRFSIATYNVHRWAGLTGGRRSEPELAAEVLGELDADVIALQEVLRPFDFDDPLAAIARDLGYHLAFVSTRIHRRGELGNAVLSRWPLTGALAIDLSFGRFEQRAALAVQFRAASGPVSIVATHLALVDRTRKQQVGALLGHPQVQKPVILLGDMNAWRRCRATRQLDEEFISLHHNDAWPPSYPAPRPVMALDRIYAQGADVLHLNPHDSPMAQRASDHLPVTATVRLHEAARSRLLRRRRR